MARTELFQSVNSIGSYHHLLSVHAVFDHGQFSMKLLQVKDPILHAAKVAVAQQIILFIGIQWTRDNRTENRLSISVRQKLFNIPQHFVANDVAQLGVISQEILGDEFMDFGRIVPR